MFRVDFYRAKHTVIYNKNLSFKKDEVYLARNSKQGVPSIYSTEGILHALYSNWRVFNFSHPINTKQRFSDMGNLFELIGSVSVQSKDTYVDLKDRYDWVRTLHVYPFESKNLVNVYVGSSLVQLDVTAFAVIANRALTLYLPLVKKGYESGILFKGNRDTMNVDYLTHLHSQLVHMLNEGEYSTEQKGYFLSKKTGAELEALKYAVAVTFLLEFWQGNTQFPGTSINMTQTSYLNLFLKAKTYYVTLANVVE